MRDLPIGNWLPLSMAAAFWLVAIFFSLPDGASGHVALAAGVLVGGLCLFFSGGVGGGVVKFFTACSLWLGPNPAFLTFAAVTVFGGFLLCLGDGLLHGRFRSVPYLPVMLLALAIALPQAPVWHAAIGVLNGRA